MEVGEEGEYIPILVTTRMTCIKMGSDESHFNVSVGSDGQNHRTVSTNHNLCRNAGRAILVVVVSRQLPLHM